jgi:GDPmannose 4,6-dehydratase
MPSDKSPITSHQSPVTAPHAPRTALICGISGQDGALLARQLLHKGYRVVGTSRDAQLSGFGNLKRLGILDDVEVDSMSLNEFRSVLQVIDRVKPDEIYNFAGQSSVGLSFAHPVETLVSHASGTLNLLEVIRYLERDIRLYNAGSGECFGNTGGMPANEGTPFHPRSPYAVAKAAAFWEAANYREAYGLYVCSGILFNHESPLRPNRFVTRKVVSAACRIAGGSHEKLKLGNLSIKRDWGWADEYVDAMWRMLQQDEAEDFVIATGESHSLEAFVEAVFAILGLDWREHVEVDASLLRPSEIMENCGDATKAKAQLGWQATLHMPQVAEKMVAVELGDAPL